MSILERLDALEREHDLGEIFERLAALEALVGAPQRLIDNPEINPEINTGPGGVKACRHLAVTSDESGAWCTECNSRVTRTDTGAWMLA